MSNILNAAASASSAISAAIKASATWASGYFGARLSVNEGTTDAPRNGLDKKSENALAAKQLVFTYFGSCAPVPLCMAICVSWCWLLAAHRPPVRPHPAAHVL